MDEEGQVGIRSWGRGRDGPQRTWDRRRKGESLLPIRTCPLQHLAGMNKIFPSVFLLQYQLKPCVLMSHVS